MLALIFFSVVSSAWAYGGYEMYGSPGREIYSHHTAFVPGSLNLTLGELKLFSGHAMNMIKGKCSAVDAEKIWKVQKYMGKLLAKKDPLPGKSPEFKSLLATITSCANEGPVKKMEEPSSNPFPFFFPFHNIRRVFIQPRPVDADVKASPEEPQPQPQPEASNAEPSDSAKEADQSENAPDAGQPGVGRRIFTTIFIRPHGDSDSTTSSGGLSSFFHQIFSGLSSVLSPSPVARRKRRSLEDNTEEIAPETPGTFDDNREAGSSFFPFAPFHFFANNPQPSQVEPKNNKGKHAFGNLVDQMCRVYCDACSGEKSMQDFKLAGKQLLEELFEEDSGLDVAAKHYLDDDFMASISSCV